MTLRTPAIALALALSGGFVFAQNLSSVTARCTRLEQAALTFTGPLKDVMAQALDDCRAELRRLTPAKVTKMDFVQRVMPILIAEGQEAWAMQYNAHALAGWKKQKNKGTVELNLGSEGVVFGFLAKSMLEQCHRQWKRQRAPKDALPQIITDSVLLPH